MKQQKPDAYHFTCTLRKRDAVRHWIFCNFQYFAALKALVQQRCRRIARVAVEAVKG